jgi:phosphoribosylamine--glycine ligase
VKVLVLGSGAREHALAARIAAEPGVSGVITAPGNGGTAALGRSMPLALDDPGAILALADSEGVGLTVVGPELPLAAGVADRFAGAGRAVVGPSAAAARLETSKVWAKEFMARHGIPTAPFRVAHTEAEALAIIERGELGWPLVVKADGLAAGKGVVVAQSAAEASDAVRAMMGERRFGDAGSRLVLESCLTGPELSFFVLAAGQGAMVLGSAQDHKRVNDGDTGPNTGGMGAFAPSPLCTEALERRLLADVVTPTLAGMHAEGHPYRGFLYCGLMLTPDGPYVIEFNARLGDPEAQVILPLIDEPLLPLLQAAAEGRLPDRRARVRHDPHVGVVIASGGYPAAFDTGKVIEGLSDAEGLPDVTVFHAGTAIRDGRVVTAGGRVLTVVGRGRDFQTAIARAYAGVDRIRFDGAYARRDIGAKALSVHS